MHLLQFAWVPTVVAPKVQSLGALLGRALFEQAPVKHARQRQARGECLHDRALISAKRPVERHDLVCWITVRSVTTVAKNALKNKTKLKEEALKSGLITEKEYDKIVDPKKMIQPA